MSDAPIEERLSAVAGRIQSALVLLPRFRPTDRQLADEFDEMTADMVQTLIEVTRAAAVDEASIIVAKDLAQQRRNFAIETQKQRDQAAADFRSKALPLLVGVAT